MHRHYITSPFDYGASNILISVNVPWAAIAKSMSKVEPSQVLTDMFIGIVKWNTYTLKRKSAHAQLFSRKPGLVVTPR